MPEKIANVIDCLKTHPNSKRATIPIPFATEGSKNVTWEDAGQTKCCRELYIFLEEDKLCCTAVLRMQNASIFPKNIHFFATLLRRVAGELGVEVGEYTSAARISLPLTNSRRGCFSGESRRRRGGDAWIFRGDESTPRPRRVAIPWKRVARPRYTHIIANLCHDRSATNC